MSDHLLQAPSFEGIGSDPSSHDGSRPSLRRVLLVTDRARERSVLMAALDSLSVATAFAESRDEALRLAEALRPEVVAIDVELPGAEGWAICEELLGRAVATAGVATAGGSAVGEGAVEKSAAEDRASVGEGSGASLGWAPSLIVLHGQAEGVEERARANGLDRLLRWPFAVEAARSLFDEALTGSRFDGVEPIRVLAVEVVGTSGAEAGRESEPSSSLSLGSKAPPDPGAVPVPVPGPDLEPGSESEPRAELAIDAGPQLFADPAPDVDSEADVEAAQEEQPAEKEEMKGTEVGGSIELEVLGSKPEDQWPETEIYKSSGPADLFVDAAPSLDVEEEESETDVQGQVSKHSKSALAAGLSVEVEPVSEIAESVGPVPKRALAVEGEDSELRGEPELSAEPEVSAEPELSTEPASQNPRHLPLTELHAPIRTGLGSEFGQVSQPGIDGPAVVEPEPESDPETRATDELTLDLVQPPTEAEEGAASGPDSTGGLLSAIPTLSPWQPRGGTDFLEVTHDLPSARDEQQVDALPRQVVEVGDDSDRLIDRLLVESDLGKEVSIEPRRARPASVILKAVDLDEVAAKEEETFRPLPEMALPEAAEESEPENVGQGQEALAPILADLFNVDGVGQVMLVEIGGGVVFTSSKTPQFSLSQLADHSVQVFAAADQLLGGAETANDGESQGAQSIVVEGDDGCVLLQAVDERHRLVVCVESVAGLGQVRFLIRRLHSRLGRALAF